MLFKQRRGKGKEGGKLKGKMLPPEGKLLADKKSQFFLRRLEEMGLSNLEIIRAFFDGTLGDYVRTPKGTAELSDLAYDEELFSKYLQALRIPGATKMMADFLMTSQGEEAFVKVGSSEPGLRTLIKIGQEPEGRRVAIHMLASPFRGWPSMFRILRRLGEETKAEDKEVELETVDLSKYHNAKELLLVIRDPENLGIVFVSFTISDENAELCKKVLKNKEARKLLFDYLTKTSKTSADTFQRIFSSEDRKRRMADIFMSRGGSKLLADLAGDVEGRVLMTKLAVSPSGRKTGIKVLLFHPITVIRVGWNYFRKPKTGLN